MMMISPLYPCAVNVVPHLAMNPDPVHRVDIILFRVLKAMQIGDAHHQHVHLRYPRNARAR